MKTLRKYLFYICFHQSQLYMLVNYRSYYRLIFTAVTTLVEEKIRTQKKNNRFIWINHINSKISTYKVNIIKKKKKNTVLIYIANDVKKTQP